MSPAEHEVRCPACDSLLSGAETMHGVDRFHGTPGDFAVIQCQSCGSGLTLPLNAPEGLSAFYPRGYGPYEGQGSGLVGVLSRMIRGYQGRRALTRAPLSFTRSLKAGRIVDVGCGRGDLAALFVTRGWQTVGVEPSPAACAVARSRGIDARQGTLGSIELERGVYDVALFHHSLEHTADPHGDLESVCAALRPGGLALITVPNFDSWQRRRFRNCWFHLDLPRHRTHFTASGLRHALERAGLQTDLITTSTSAVGLPATVQYAIAGRCLFPSGLSLRIASGLCVLALPLARILDALHGGGDQLHVVARRAA